MIHSFSGANTRRSTSPGMSKGNQGHSGGQSDLHALLSNLELRQLVAAMVD
ncbi:hypothetical protein [Altererythrobacter sp.]|uniref:hypothetical protein n=1 Tax=Altererythrobacter sp. TaxID=1872480 RepID=UPI003D045128